METYRKIRGYVCTLFKVIMACLLFVLVALATVQVVTRYFVSAMIIWVEELSIYLMTWMCAVGVSWIWMEKSGHIKMDILDNVLPKKVIRWMDVMIDAVTAVLGIAVIRIGLKTQSVNAGLVMSTINLDEGDRYLPVTVGGFLLVGAALCMLVEHIYVATRGKEEAA